MKARSIVAACATFTLALGVAAAGHAQDSYPNKAVKLLIGFPPGGLLDTVSRIVGERMAALRASAPRGIRSPLAMSQQAAVTYTALWLVVCALALVGPPCCEAKSGCISHRRHLVEFRQGWIDVVPRVTAHAVRHHLRLVSAWIVKARSAHGEKIRHSRKRHIYR
jgi:hypothetical protein